MKILTLKRLDENVSGTFGYLFGDNFMCTTLERTWENNQREISRIPEGEYTCSRIISPKFGETFEVTQVPNRTNILFHRGNLFENSRGCILVGTGYGKINNQWGITDSGAGFSNFYKYLMGENEFKLVIKAA